MKTLHVGLEDRSYPIHMGAGLLAQAGSACSAALPRCRRAAVVTDSNVAPLYSAVVTESLAAAGIETELVVVDAGEASKSLTQLGRLYDAFCRAGLTRTDAVVALGGGVVGDLAGFAAATFLRGMDFIQLPTTLLAQVDSSVGGKVAINLPAGKNLAGAFWQPKLVLMDTDCLSTLDDETFASGMAEVIKYGCIGDMALFERLEQRPGRAAVMEEIAEILYACCDRKRVVVEQDERDTGARMVLNFGHTLGHAYERAGDYTRWTHGQAVAAGMCLAASLGVQLGVTPAGVPARVAALVEAFGLPSGIACSLADYTAAVGLDKKGVGDEITLVLLEQLGRAALVPMGKERLYGLLGPHAQ